MTYEDEVDDMDGLPSQINNDTSLIGHNIDDNNIHYIAN